MWKLVLLRESPAQGILEGDNISNWARDHSCDILARKMAAFCRCPKNLPVAEWKCLGLISLQKVQDSLILVCLVLVSRLSYVDL